MTEVLLARARDIVEKFPFPRAPKPAETTLFIAGHGTGNNENSRKAIERQVELIGAKNLFARVFAVFMEEDPRIGDCYKLAETKNLVVAPFFISDGLHSFEDIPVMLGAPRAVVRERLKLGQPTWRNPTEREGKRLWYTASVGSEPHMAEVILERVREAATPLQ
jgi:sirohydrochlorin cobaltochelatase